MPISSREAPQTRHVVRQQSSHSLRVAVIGSPRSGNTWLRGLLALIYGLDELAVPTPEQVDWDTLPARCALQIHWLRQEPFVSLLERHGFQVVSPARHPLDVLISSLNYQQYVPEPHRWVGADGQERTLVGATPRSPAFLEYAGSNHPGSLLSFTPDWWAEPSVHRVRYEDLIADGVGTMKRLVEWIDPRGGLPIDKVVAARSLEQERSQPGVWHYHFWQAEPGLWRRLLPAWVARQIADAQLEVFQALGYHCDPDANLTDDRADANWHALQHATIRRHLQSERARHEETRQALVRATQGATPPSHKAPA